MSSPTDGQPGRAVPNRLIQCQQGVSDVLGEILLLAVAVALITFLAVTLQPEPPIDTLHFGTHATISCGSTGWGQGDETLRIRHIAGEPVESEALTIRVLVNGQAHTFPGVILDQGFSDGILHLGEEWSATLTIPEQAVVRYQFLRDEGGGDSSIVADRGIDERRCRIV